MTKIGRLPYEKIKQESCYEKDQNANCQPNSHSDGDGSQECVCDRGYSTFAIKWNWIFAEKTKESVVRFVLDIKIPKIPDEI